MVEVRMFNGTIRKVPQEQAERLIAAGKATPHYTLTPENVKTPVSS